MIKGNLSGSKLHDAAMRIICGLAGEPNAGHHANAKCPSCKSDRSRSESQTEEDDSAGASEEFRVIRSFAARCDVALCDRVSAGEARFDSGFTAQHPIISCA